MSPVLKKASDPAILEAILRSFATKSAMVSVLAIAKSRQTNALVRDRPISSAPDLRPAWLLFMSRSPINMVKALLKKSDPTMLNAVVRDPLKRRDVTKVTDPAMMRQQKALTADRSVVSEKLVLLEPSDEPLRYSRFFDSRRCMLDLAADNAFSASMTFLLRRACFLLNCFKTASLSSLSLVLLVGNDDATDRCVEKGRATIWRCVMVDGTAKAWTPPSVGLCWSSRVTLTRSNSARDSGVV